MDLEFQKLIEERLQIIPEELVRFLLSKELPRKIELVARKYKLTEKETEAVSRDIAFLLILLDSTDNLLNNLKESITEHDEQSLEFLASDIMEYVLKPISSFLVPNKESLILEETEPIEEVSIKNPEPQGIKTEQGTPTPTNETLSRDSILSEIENPRKTTLKRYVVEYDHKPVTDSSHLIDNKQDDIIKLEEKYTD